jgi:hypothetical protein
MRPRLIDCPDLAGRLKYACQQCSWTYKDLRNRLLDDPEFRSECPFQNIDPGTINRWVLDRRFPDRVVVILNRILSDDGVPECRPEEHKAFQQIEPMRVTEFLDQVVEVVLELAERHPKSLIEFHIAPANLRSTAAWLGELVRQDIVHRVGTIRCKTMRPDLLVSMVTAQLIPQDYLDSFATNLWSIRSTLERYSPAGSIAVVGHFRRIPPFHATMVGVDGVLHAAWANRWEADDEGRLNLDTSWIRRVSPGVPTGGHLKRLSSLFEQQDIPVLPGCSEPPSPSGDAWRTAIARSMPTAA